MVAPTDRWRELLAAAREHANVSSLPVNDEHLALMREAGMPLAIAELLSIGYPDRPLTIGTLAFFPSLEAFGRSGRWPRLFFITESWANPHELHRRLSLNEDAETEMMEAATQLLNVTQGADSMGHEARPAGPPLVYWRPSVEHALEDELGAERADRVITVLGGGLRGEDYRVEIESRLMWARSWFLLGVASIFYVLSRDGSFSGRLFMAGVSFAILGLGLGLAPWMRENARLKALDD